MRSLLDRRISGEPLAYILGRREFYGLDFHVTPDTLIPRQETELLVEIALERLARAAGRPPLAVDAGAGSGAIAIAIAAQSKNARLVATDVSQGALEVAKRNALALGLRDRIEFVRGDMLAPVRGLIDVVVSNPPYIPSGMMASLPPEVRREPRLALDGGADGLAPFRNLLRQACDKLAPGGVLAVELMPEQMDEARTLAADSMPREVRVTVRNDLMGSERALVVERAVSGGQPANGRNPDAR